MVASAMPSRLGSDLRRQFCSTSHTAREKQNEFGRNVRVEARHGARADSHEKRVDGGHVLGRIQDNHPENAEPQNEGIW